MEDSFHPDPSFEDADSSADSVSDAPGSIYPPEAFEFVREGLEYTVHAIHGPQSDLTDGEDRHVNGRQLSLGLRDHAIRRFGLMTHSVLGYWNIHRSDDFGRIVYAMIEQSLLSRTDRDRQEDFYGVFDFEEAFSGPAVEEALAQMREEGASRG